MHRLSASRQALCQAALLLVGIFVLLPLWSLSRLALDGAIKSVPTAFTLWPQQPTLGVFGQVWQRASQSLSFLGLLANSLWVSCLAAGLSVVMGASTAYAFARLRFAGRRVGLLSLLVGAFLPPVALMTPLYLILESLHLRDSTFGLVLVYAAFSLPFCIWNMRAAFQAAPRELEEAAALDGATPLGCFLRVALPLALPAIGTAALVAFLGAYSEFAVGWLFVENGRDVTLAMAIWGMRTMGGVPWSQIAAMAILMTLPVTAVFLVLRKALFDRMAFGSPE